MPKKLFYHLLNGLHLFLIVDVRVTVQHEVLKIILNRFPMTNQAILMYNMTKKYFHQLLDGLHIVLVVEVREGVQHVSEVLKIILSRFPIKN